jgi:hypothetical protein
MTKLSLPLAFAVVLLQSTVTLAAGPTKPTPGAITNALILDSRNTIVATYLGKECGSRDFDGQRIDFCIYDERMFGGIPAVTYFPSSDCSGVGYFYAQTASGLSSDGPDNVMLLQAAKFVYAALPIVAVRVHSYKYLDQCGATEFTITGGEAREASFASLGFVPPFRIK